ncbi:hypothetical protein D1871_12080 [Nakamurella silvestris]|nr:hypothetical protein D1871_12080 [Nakamurella silvestris]
MSGPWNGSTGDPQGNYQGGYPQPDPGMRQEGYPYPGTQGGPAGFDGGFNQAEYNRAAFQQAPQHPGGPNGYQPNGYDQAGPGFPPPYQPGYQPGPYGQPPRNRNGMVIAVLVGILVLAGAGIGSYFLFFKKDSDAGAGGTSISATAVAGQLKAAIDSNNYNAVNDLTCTAEKVTPQQIQDTVTQIQQAGATITVTIDSVQENEDTAAVIYTINSVNATTGQTDQRQQTATLHKNAAGHWLACDGTLGPEDQG